jgi:hypothetical protein
MSDSQRMVLSSHPCCQDEFCTQVAHCACSWRWFRGQTECDVLFHKSAFTGAYRARSNGTKSDPALYMEAPINEASLDDEEIEDDRLRPIFTCRRPALPPEGQVALTLREICGLTTEEIARASLVTPVPSAPVLPTVVTSIQTLAAAYITFVSITNWPCGDKKKELCRT